MDNSNNQNLTRYIHTVLAKLSASGGGGGDEPSSAKIEFVDTLPTASEDTVGIFYVIPNPDGNTGTIHITKNDGSTYSWVTVRDPETANVQYTQQTLTEAQKQQARNNIDAASLADIENLDYVTAATLPTASAETMGHVYLIGPDSSNNYQRYYTQQNGSSYSWVDLGSTQLDLSTYATEAEVIQLEAEVTDLEKEVDGNEFALFNEGKLSAKIVKDEYVNNTYGTFTHFAGWDRTDYINIHQFTKLKITTTHATSYAALYDAEKRFIDKVQFAAGVKNLSVPENAYYLVISDAASYVPTITYEIVEYRFDAVSEALTSAVEGIIPDKTTVSGDFSVGIEGYYINAQGTLVAYQSYAISNPVSLKKGDILTARINATGVTYLASPTQVEGVYTVILSANTYIQDLNYEATEDVDVVVCQALTQFTSAPSYNILRASRKAASDVAFGLLTNRVTALEGFITQPYTLINPYSGVNFGNKVAAQSHEHSFRKELLESAYTQRNIRMFAVSHYGPSVPRYPLSKTPLTWMDYKSRQAVDNGDTELIERTQTQNTGITSLDIDGNSVQTDEIPQIANAERPYFPGFNHFNVLGLLWGDPGVTLANSEQDVQWKLAHTLETKAKFDALLEDATQWQFGLEYIFATINHCDVLNTAKNMLDTYPQMFKAMELFNQGYSEGRNQLFRNTYDSLLRQGYKIWGTSVVDWQGDWATWAYTTQAEKDEWQDKYDALTPEEQAEYGSAENYYMETGRYKFNRGANVLLMPDNYDSLSTFLKAKEGIKAYIQGRYYMVGVGNYSMTLSTDGNTITFRVSDFSPKIRVVTANGATEYSGTDTVRYTPIASDKYVRFEAFWDDGDFVFSNPIWVEE